MSLRLVIALTFLAFVATSGCKHPYSGKPERMKKPRPKKPKKKEGDDKVAKVDPNRLVDKCRTNFFADPKTRRRARDARKMAMQADKLLMEAEGASRQERVPIVTDAMDRLVGALRKDPYGPLPTYKLAVAYALVNHKGCALALLERLKLLQDYPPVEREATRTVKRAVRDLAFDRFKEDARTALGE